MESPLTGGQANSYRIETADANRFCDAVVEQRGIDVVVSLFNPEGRKLAEVDSPNGAVGPERLSVVLERPGAYRLEVRSLEKEASGRYEIRLAELRLASKTDITRRLAQQAFADAEQLRKSATLESRRAAIVRYQEAQRQFATLADVAGESDSFTGLARVLYNLGDNQPALEAYQHALEGKRNVGDRQAEAYLLHNMGAVYSHLGEFPKSLDHHTQALALQRSLGNQAVEGMALSSIGALHDEMDEKEKALVYYQQALALRRQVKHRRGEGATLHNMGALYKDLGEYPSTISSSRWKSTRLCGTAKAKASPRT